MNRTRIGLALASALLIAGCGAGPTSDDAGALDGATPGDGALDGAPGDGALDGATPGDGGACTPGSCPPGQMCSTEGLCIDETCTPDCGGRTCGLDPVCGRSCGDCPPGQECLVGGTCDACASDMDCFESPRGARCDTDSGLCSHQCTTDAHCAADPFGAVCDTGSGFCVECFADVDCADGRLCDTDNVCRFCRSDADCSDGDNPYCDRVGPIDLCLPCRTAADCDAGFGCAPGACLPGCTDDTECSGRCHPTVGLCAECVTDVDCSDGRTCSPGGDCLECASDADCASSPSGFVCHRSGFCGGCRDHRDCVGNPDGEQCNPVSGTCAECVPGDLCAGRPCGDGADGCGGIISCGSCGTTGTCSADGSDCACPADAIDLATPDDTAATAQDLGSLTDDPDSRFEELRTIHDDADEDWYTMHVEDTGFLGNPSVSVLLFLLQPDDSSSWNLGEDTSQYELSVFYSCDAGGDAHTCERSSVGFTDPVHGPGCIEVGAYGLYPWVILDSSCSTTDDSGTVLIRVRKTERQGRCDFYDFKLGVY